MTARYSCAQFARSIAIVTASCVQAGLRFGRNSSCVRCVLFDFSCLFSLHCRIRKRNSGCPECHELKPHVFCVPTVYVILAAALS